NGEELWWATKYYTIDPRSLEFKYLLQWYRESYSLNVQATQ
ncbi:6572_t:CDS:1, partial [Dentiscutata erythropus]